MPENHVSNGHSGTSRMSRQLQSIFREIPSTYEFLNHLLTFGQDISWRRQVARKVAQANGTLWLDVCTGTGELAALLHSYGGNTTTIVASDFSLPMLEEAIARGRTRGIGLITVNDASRLPFSDRSFDAVTISLAVRNLNSAGKLKDSLKEFHRVLKPHGLLVMLETSQPKHLPIRWLFHRYIQLTVYPIGTLVSRSSTAYNYLSQSMREFYSAEELAQIISDAGFTDVRFKRLLLGAAAIHQANK